MKEQTFIEKGYVAYSGHTFTKAEAETYNHYTKEIERYKAAGRNTDGLLDRRALFFKQVIYSEKKH